MDAVLSASCWGRSSVCLPNPGLYSISRSHADSPVMMELFGSDLEEAERQTRLIRIVHTLDYEDSF